MLDTRLADAASATLLIILSRWRTQPGTRMSITRSLRSADLRYGKVDERLRRPYTIRTELSLSAINAKSRHSVLARTQPETFLVFAVSKSARICASNRFLSSVLLIRCRTPSSKSPTMVDESLFTKFPMEASCGAEAR